MAFSLADLRDRLDSYFHQVNATILSRQHPITGLLPASTAITTHGNYTDAWVRDNVYSILAVWGLGLAYRKLEQDEGRTFLLEQSVVKLMRGLLLCMMRQRQKVERFKFTQSPLDALHAKYDTATGDPVVGDEEWGHLQLDATSLYLLMLAQMTASGLHLIFSLDEVNFIQNLVYYIGRAYRAPDYGIWERGNKINKGKPELNASSVGMAKAALEAMDGLDLFGARGSQASVIHVLPDEIARARITLESLLPRESSSKEVDAASLSVISFPAFAVTDPTLVHRTRTKIVDKLQGHYGCKRFLRDGHQTVLEDTSRLYYEAWELQTFEHIECEWPLFFVYLLLDGLFRGDRPQIAFYQQQISRILVERDGLQLLPELYIVPQERIAAEKINPHSQPRIPNGNVPLVWAQSLYLLSQLILDDCLALGDIDPLGRHLRLGRDRQVLVQVALLAEDEDLQEQLATYGIATQTPTQLEPIQVRQASELAASYTQVGRNDRLGLSGRPPRRLRSLSTSHVFHIKGQPTVFLPSFLDQRQFYLTLDGHFLVAQIRGELAYVQRHWYHLGRPTMTLLLTRSMVEHGQQALLALMQELKSGWCHQVPVKVGSLTQLMLTAGQERLDNLNDFEFTDAPVRGGVPISSYLPFAPGHSQPLSPLEEARLERETDLDALLSQLRHSTNLYEQIELLQNLTHHWGLTFETGWGHPDRAVTVADLLNEVYVKAGQSCLWSVVRRAAGLLHKVDISLSEAVTNILVCQKQITVGRSYSEGSMITHPLPPYEIMEKINQFCREDIRDRVLTQEVLIYLDLLIKSDPDCVKGLLTLRVGYLILLLTSELARERQIPQDEAYEDLMHFSPFEVKTRLRRVLKEYASLNQVLRQQESLHVRQPDQELNWDVLPAQEDGAVNADHWHRKRQIEGSLNRVPQDFYPRVWVLLNHTKGLIIGDKLERRNRLESATLLSEMTAGEKNFALHIEHLLNKIQAPEYRQLTIEALMELSAIAQHNPNLQVDDYIVLDVLIGHAVRLAWLEQNPDRRQSYDQDKAAAWGHFYNTSPYHCAGYFVKAFRFLTAAGQPLAA